jgi:hypothetical protein
MEMNMRKSRMKSGGLQSSDGTVFQWAPPFLHGIIPLVGFSAMVRGAFSSLTHFLHSCPKFRLLFTPYVALYITFHFSFGT